MKKEIDNERLQLEEELLMTCSKSQMIEKYIDELEENRELRIKQKKFIDYLEYQVKLQEELKDIHLATGFEEILSKYKEINSEDTLYNWEHSYNSMFYSIINYFW